MDNSKLAILCLTVFSIVCALIMWDFIIPDRPPMTEEELVVETKRVKLNMYEECMDVALRYNNSLPEKTDACNKITL